MNPESGRRFGPYEIQSRLGGGGMGHVYRAWDARLHREVAIKLLNHEYTMPGMRERFLREARAASALNHPNICSIFDIGEQDGDPYLVMELLEGETLRDRILSRSMPLDEMVAAAREVAEALGAAHSKGVIHRDIKPANIFLVRKPNGEIQAKVLDFGLAKIEGGALGARGRSLELTTVGATVGTLAYMSPEQARGEVLDSRSDLFSLGVVMYEMATRQVPFQGATSALVFVQLLNHAPEPVREWNDSIPRDLEKIIFKLLAKERTARFQTARELELALLALNEKGGWLRKAVATVPLVRASDPVVRARKTSRPAESDASNRAILADSRPSQGSGEFIRPIARVPRGDPAAGSPRNTPSPEQTAARANLSPTPQTVSQPEQASSNPFTGAVLPRPPAQPLLQDVTLPQAGIGSGSSGAARRAFDEVQALQEPALRSPTGTMPWVETQTDVQFPPLFEPPPRRSPRLPALPVRVAAVALVGLTAAAALYYFFGHGHFGAVTLGPGDSVVVTEIQNRTTESVLDGSVAEALSIALAQSPMLHLRSAASYQAARNTAAGSSGAEAATLAAAHRAAERLGVRAFLYGSVEATKAGYNLKVELRDVSTDDVLASADEAASSLQQLPMAIDQVAIDLRAAVGEDRASTERSAIPLAREGSQDFAALRLLAQAERLMAAQEPVSALADLEQAIKLDPRFTQAHLHLAELYAELLAETAAADAAQHALDSAAEAGERTRTLAKARYETEATGDYNRAIALLRHFLSTAAHDSELEALLALTLTREGHMAEALQVAQQAYADDPFNEAAYAAAERALIGLDRYDAAFQLDSQVQRLGLARRDDSFMAAVLAGRRNTVDELASGISAGKTEYRRDWSYGIYLDNEGRLNEGAAFWRSRAESAAEVANLGSAAASLLAQGALDRALLGDCATALSMAHVDASGEPVAAGRMALFKAGMAYALCGGSGSAEKAIQVLQQRYPSSFEVRGFWIANMEAANALHGHDPAGALDDLRQARQYDLISLTPYLRGRAHADLLQMEIGIVDYQTVLSHRGTTYLAGSDVYSAAEIGVARAFAATGDAGNSAEAYRQFLELWPNADPASPLLNEARKHTQTR